MSERRQRVTAAVFAQFCSVSFFLFVTLRGFKSNIATRAYAGIVIIVGVALVISFLLIHKRTSTANSNIEGRR